MRREIENFVDCGTIVSFVILLRKKWRISLNCCQKGMRISSESVKNHEFRCSGCGKMRILSIKELKTQISQFCHEKNREFYCQVPKK